MDAEIHECDVLHEAGLPPTHVSNPPFVKDCADIFEKIKPSIIKVKYLIMLHFSYKPTHFYACLVHIVSPEKNKEFYWQWTTVTRPVYIVSRSVLFTFMLYTPSDRH